MTAVTTRPRPARRPAGLLGGAFRPGAGSPGTGPARPGSNPSPFVTAGAELSLVVVTMASGLGLARLFTGAWFAVPVLGAAAAGHAVAWGCRRRGLGLVPAALVSLAGGVLAVVWLVEIRTTTLLIPRGGTWAAIDHDLRDAWQRFGQVKAPTAPLRGFLVAAVAGVWATATTSDFFAFRVRARFEAMAPAFTLFVFGSILGSTHLRLPVTALYLAAVLSFVLWTEAARRGAAWFAGRTREGDTAVLRTGAALAVAALAGAVLIGPHLPGATGNGLLSWRDNGDNASRSRVTVSPLVDIRSRLVDQSNVELFTVGASTPAYWRLTSLDRFDGTIWSSLGTYQPSKGSLPGASTGTTIDQTYRISALGTIWLPAAYRPAQVSNVKGARYDKDSSSLLASAATADGLDYQVVSVAPDLSAAELAATTQAIPADIANRYLGLPASLPPVIAETARAVTLGATTNYDKARRLQDWFRENFTYTLAVPAGHDDNAMVRFLDDRQGYCEQFAGTFAAMARALGIPARVAVGFVPGTVGTDGLYHVDGKDAHAWPEVYLGSYGWVPFEPTPGAGRTAPGTQAYTGVGTAGGGSSATTTPTTVASADQGATTTLASGQVPPEPTTTGRATGSTSPVRLAVELLAGFALLYLVAVPLARREVLRRRRRRAATPTDQVMVAWTESEEALARTGQPRHRWETAQEFADRSAPRLPSSAPQLVRLAADTNAAGFSSGGVSPDTAAAARSSADAVTAEVNGQAGRVRLALWALDPRPLAKAARRKPPSPPS